MRPSKNMENKIFRHILKRSASMHESSGSQFCRTMAWIQSATDAFDESRFVMTFLTIMGVNRNIMQFQISFRRENRFQCQEIPESSRLEFLEKFLGNNFALSDAEYNTSGPLNRGGIADIPLLRTLLAICQKSRELSFWEVMDPFFSSIYKFGSFKNSFATITSLSELYFRFRRFILLVQMKKVISMNYDSSTSCWKPWWWVRLDLIFPMRDIYINSNLNLLTKFTSSSRSTKFKDILPWNISQMITKTIPVSMRIVISHTMKRSTLFWVYWKVNGNWDNDMIRISQWRESHYRTNTSFRRNK